MPDFGCVGFVGSSVRMRVPKCLVLVALLLLPLPALASPGTFTGWLSVHLGQGTGSATAVGTPGRLLTYFGGSAQSSLINQPLFPAGVPAGIFSNQDFLPSATHLGGTVPLPTAPNSIYVLGQVVNQSNPAGSFGAGLGPAGGFGGTMNVGMTIRILLGISSFPGVFGSLELPIGAGSTGTQMAAATVLGNPVTVTALGQAWTTGVVKYGTGPAGTALATAGTVTGFHGVSTSFNSHPTNTLLPATTIIRQSFNLVTPILIRTALDGSPLDARAGYARLQFQVRQVLPEPATAVLIGALGLVGAGLSRRRVR